MLGQVYNLILSWRSAKRELETTSSETLQPHVGETVKPAINQNGGSDD
jgi:hypothetical protein